MTLVDEIGGMQLAIQAAVANAFKTPEVCAGVAMHNFHFRGAP